MAVEQSTLIASPSPICPWSLTGSSLWGPVFWLEVGGGQAGGRAVSIFKIKNFGLLTSPNEASLKASSLVQRLIANHIPFSHIRFHIRVQTGDGLL